MILWHMRLDQGALCPAHRRASLPTTKSHQRHERRKSGAVPSVLRDRYVVQVDFGSRSIVRCRIDSCAGTAWRNETLPSTTSKSRSNERVCESRGYQKKTCYCYLLWIPFPWWCHFFPWNPMRRCVNGLYSGFVFKVIIDYWLRNRDLWGIFQRFVTHYKPFITTQTSISSRHLFSQDLHLYCFWLNVQRQFCLWRLSHENIVCKAMQMCRSVLWLSCRWLCFWKLFWAYFSST